MNKWRKRSIVNGYLLYVAETWLDCYIGFITAYIGFISLRRPNVLGTSLWWCCVWLLFYSMQMRDSMALCGNSACWAPSFLANWRKAPLCSLSSAGWSYGSIGSIRTLSALTMIPGLVKNLKWIFGMPLPIPYAWHGLKYKSSATSSVGSPRNSTPSLTWFGF